MQIEKSMRYFKVLKYFSHFRSAKSIAFFFFSFFLFCIAYFMHTLPYILYAGIWREVTMIVSRGKIFWIF